VDRLPLLTGLLTAWALLTTQVAKGEEPFSLPLECQLESARWQPCTLTVERLGEHWWLQVGGRRLDFHHNGRGQIELQEAARETRLVQPHWRSEQALCWGAICAKGALPLD
jgi:hypothetical protein